MRTNKRLKFFLLIIIVLYFLIGAIPRYYVKPEIFPISSWDLFSYIPSEIVDYGIKFTEINVQELQSPVYFEMAEQWIPDAHSIVAQKNIQRLGRAIAGQSAEQIQTAQARLESVHLQHLRSATYILIQRRFHPLSRWRTGELIEEKELYTFTIRE